MSSRVVKTWSTKDKVGNTLKCFETGDGEVVCLRRKHRTSISEPPTRLETSKEAELERLLGEKGVPKYGRQQYKKLEKTKF